MTTATDAFTLALIHLIDQGLQVLRSLDAVLYRKRRPLMQGTIGGHFRHIADHIQAFLKGVESGQIEYDRRERGGPLEFQPEEAAAFFVSLRKQLGSLADETLDARVHVEVFADWSSGLSLVETNVRRELAFLISHTIHHYAYIGSMLVSEKISLPEHFGLAPSTIQFIEENERAGS